MNSAKYIIALAATVSIVNVRAATNPYKDLLPSGVLKIPSVTAKIPMPAMAGNLTDSTSWCPGSALYYDWDGNQWTPYGKYTFSYDSGCKITEELSKSLSAAGKYVKYTKRLYTYDALGRLTHSSLLAGETLDNLKELQHADLFYDEILTDLIIKQDSYSLTDTGWTPDDQSFRRNITRDKEGNIIEMTAQTYFGNDFIDVESLKAVYIEGQPVTLKERMLTQDDKTGELKMKETEVYTDCQWYSTDGQITSLDDITVGSNHLRSANVTTHDVSDMKMSIIYKEDSDDYISTSTATLMYVVPTTTVFEYTHLPNGGSCQKTTQDMDIPQYGHAQKIMTLNNQFDAWGNLIISKQVTTYGATTIDKWLEGEFVRDEQYGFPLQYVQKEFFQYQGQTSGEWKNRYKVEYSDYVQPSAGIDTTGIAGNAASDVCYFTLDGRRYDGTPTQGIYVKVRKNSFAEKIIIK